ncbi:6318_t:CDS:2 [Funneliformis mosseae]|uniref:6318_t:CDS:1 n=1 Tax=Funneliformis mosseae TaxID=27381 RepID=A0A9N9GUI7_FUNMO|nr:6318_t:CDS:2 [Funneliformis mosseae]
MIAGIYNISEITPNLLFDLLNYPEVYIESGTSNYGLPMNQLTSDKGLVWVLSVPFNYGFYSNWWNIKIFKGRVRANQALYERIFHDLPHEGDNNIYRGILNSDLLYSGSMGNSGITPTIEIEILNYRTISTASSSASVSEKKEVIKKLF